MHVRLSRTQRLPPSLQTYSAQSADHTIAHRSHNHKMPPMPFVYRNIHTLRSMLPHASPIQQNHNTLSRSPPITTERILFCFHKDNLPRALYHIIQILRDSL